MAEEKIDKIPRWHVPLLILIVAVGFAVRAIGLDRVPPGFYIDEASFGYNAWSILETGRDEFGNFLPLYTPSFGTGKNPVYLYATVASVAAFGLNEFAVRLPAAVFGALTVWFTYLLAWALFGRRGIGYLAALFLALEPWHIFFSRFAIETISVPFFTTLGFYLLLRGLKRPGLLPMGGLALGAGLYTYAPALPFIPIMFLIFIFCYRKQLSGLKKPLAWAAAILFIMSIPHVVPGIKPVEQNRHFMSSTVFNPEHDADSRKILKESPWPAPLFAGASAGTLRAAVIVRNYLSNYSPRYLFTNGDMSTWRARVRSYGAFHRVFLPVLIVGLPMIIFSRAPERRFLLWWLLAYPLGAAITNQIYPQATRTTTALPAYEIIFALAVVGTTDVVRRQLYSNVSTLARFSQKVLIIFASAFILVYFLCAAWFMHRYFKEYPEYSSLEWNAGFREAFAETEKLKKDFYEVVVTENIPYSYIYVLFYTNYDPAAFQAEQTAWHSDYRSQRIGDYVVRDPYLQYRRRPQLFVAGFWELPNQPEIPIRLPDGIRSKVKVVKRVPDNE